jgi:hypothetical protein
MPVEGLDLRGKDFPVGANSPIPLTEHSGPPSVSWTPLPRILPLSVRAPLSTSEDIA